MNSFLFLSCISLVWYCWKSLAKSRGFGKNIKRGVVYRAGVQTFCTLILRGWKGGPWSPELLGGPNWRGGPQTPLHTMIIKNKILFCNTVLKSKFYKVDTFLIYQKMYIKKVSTLQYLLYISYWWLVIQMKSLLQNKISFFFIIHSSTYFCFWVIRLQSFHKFLLKLF